MKKNIKIPDIAFFIHTLGRGGAEKVLVELVNGIDKRKFNITIYTILNTGNLLTQIDENVEVISLISLPRFVKRKHTNSSGTLKKGTGDNLSFFAELYTLIWRHFSWIFTLVSKRKVGQHDLYISYLEGPTSKLVSNMKTNKPKIAWVHVDLTVEKKSMKFFKNKKEGLQHFKSFKKIVAVSDDVGQSINKLYDVDFKPLIMHNIYNIEEINYDSAKQLVMENKKLFSKSKINVVSVGRLSKQKGYDRLIDALTGLPMVELEKLNILVIGDGEEKSVLEETVKKRKLTEVIKFVGFKNNPYQFIKNADAFISTSRTEGFSTVVVESLIIGTPVFTTDCSGMAEILEGGRLGIIEKNDIKGISVLLKNIIENYDNSLISETMIIEGKNKFNTAEQIEVHEVFFNEMIQGD